MTDAERVRALFARDKRFLWALCYRMLGTPQDADDVVQETFLRLLSRPPADLDLPLRPWLTRVAMNLARDHLRARRRRGYHGPWLPGPVPTSEALPDTEAQPEARYGLVESLAFAFLVAVEDLTPSQRAVLVLRDVFGFSVRDTAAAIEISEANVKVTLHRAHAAMREYDASRPRTRANVDRVREMMLRFFAAVTTEDLTSAKAVLAAGVVELNDGGREFLAAKKPVIGIDRVLNFNANLARKYTAQPSLEFAEYNGTTAAVLRQDHGNPRVADRTVILIDLDDDGLVCRIYAVLASDKLSRLSAG